MNTRLLAVALMVLSASACEQANRLEETLTGKPALVAEPAPLLAIPEHRVAQSTFQARGQAFRGGFEFQVRRGTDRSR